MDHYFLRMLEEHERIRSLIEPPSVELLRRLEREHAFVREFAEPTELEQLREIQDQAQFINQAQDQLKALEPLQQEIQNAFRGYKSVWDQINDALQESPLRSIDAFERANRILDRVGNVGWPSNEILDSSRAIKALMSASLSDQVALAMQPDLLAAGAIVASAVPTLNALRESSLLVDAIAIAQEEASNDVFDAEEFVSRVVAGVNDRLKTAESPLELASIIQVALFLMTLISMVIAGMSYMEAQESNELAVEEAQDEEQRTEMIVEGLKKIEEAVRGISTESSELFIIVSPVSLRETTDNDADVVLDLNSGDIVETLERNGRWAKVAYYDRIQGQTAAGWVEVDVLREISTH
jgi:SH3-like domain-containing protein